MNQVDAPNVIKFIDTLRFLCQSPATGKLVVQRIDNIIKEMKSLQTCPKFNPTEFIESLSAQQVTQNLDIIKENNLPLMEQAVILQTTLTTIESYLSIRYGYRPFTAPSQGISLPTETKPPKITLESFVNWVKKTCPWLWR